MDLEWTHVPARDEQELKQVPTPRGYHTASLIGGRLYVFGGNGHECCLDDLYVCDLGEDLVPARKNTSHTMRVPRCRWQKVETSGKTPGARRSQNAVVVDDSRLVVFGGFNNEWEVLPLDMHVLDTGSRTWHTYRTSPAGPKGRAGASADVVNGVVYMIGGNTGEQRTNQVLAMSTDSMHAPMWTVLHPSGTPPAPRSAHTTAVVGNKILVFGGWNGSQDFNDLHIFDTERTAWETVSCPAGIVPRPCSGHWAVPLVDKIVLFGGQVDTGDTFIDDMYMFRPRSDTFQKIRPFNTETLPIRSGHSVTKLDSQRALIFGGWNGEDFTSDIFIVKMSSMRSDVAALCNL